MPHAPRLVLAAVFAAALSGAAPGGLPPDEMPYAAAGLTREQAAAHLLSRFAYGARPGEVARVALLGPERWLDEQLAGRLPEADLERRLTAFPAVAMPEAEVRHAYRSRNEVAAEMRDAGLISGSRGGAGTDSLRAYRDAVDAYMRERGYLPDTERDAQLVGQHLVRAAFAENQLREVLTAFWFNHFNVAAQDKPARPYLLAYERDAVRPNALGAFRALLGATARDPAMLHYLDNTRSSAAMDAPTLGRARPNRRRGVNENYARELMELHTLGVDGGYTQADVEAVARAFTGWTVWPDDAQAAERLERQMGGRRGAGILRDGLFVFVPDRHDAGAKTILGRTLPAGQGIEDGEAVLDLLATHPATARHIARALAVRFVQDDPPEALVARLAGVFTQSGGDASAVVRAIAYSPDFWSLGALEGKVKSPLELAVSAVRATGADVQDARGLAAHVAEMGQPLYRYVAPTGFPDRADAWLSAGTVAARVRFGLAFATGGVPGISLDAARLAPGATTTEASLAALAPRVLSPVRPTGLDALARVATDPGFGARLAAAAEPLADVEPEGAAMTRAGVVPRRRARRGDRAAAPRDTSAPAQALGVLLGSPAFQRR